MKTKMEKVCKKLLNNAIHGETMETLRNRINVRLKKQTTENNI